jgi:hypothetical protein
MQHSDRVVQRFDQMSLEELKAFKEELKTVEIAAECAAFDHEWKAAGQRPDDSNCE